MIFKSQNTALKGEDENMNIVLFLMEMKLIGRKSLHRACAKREFLHILWLFRALDVKLSLSKMHFSIGVDRARAWIKLRAFFDT